MKYKEMTTAQKNFCLDVVCNIYDSKARKVHTKSNAARAVKAAFHNAFSAWPVISASTIDTLLQRAKKERGIITMPESTGKGIICTYSPKNNNTPAFVDHTQSIVATQNKIGSTIKNLRENGIYPLAVIMLPAAQAETKQISETMQPIQNGNIQIANEIQKTRQASQVRYRQIAYIVDDNGNEIEINNQKAVNE